MGGCNVIPHLTGERAASDSNVALITLYNAFAGGWRPPEQVSETDYAALKARQDPNDPLTTFVGFGVSYGGKWFGGLARDPTSGRDFVATARRGLERKIAACGGVPFVAMDYREAEPRGCTIYADPPYATGTQYDGVAAFDSAAFWAWARIVSRSNVLLVSEYHAPADFECIAEFPVRKSRFAGAQVERLFRYAA